MFEEDCDGENLKHLFKELNLRPNYVVICEPSNNKIALGHKGKAQISIKTHGVSAHGSAPEKGINAIYEMAEIIQRNQRPPAELGVWGWPLEGAGASSAGGRWFLKFFYLCFIGPVGFDEHWPDESLASILFASASFGGGCSAGTYQQIVKNVQKKIYFNS